jgi:16S rRNA (guanine527-N7)-methyltransferase
VDIPSLLRPYIDPLSPAQLDQVSTYLDLLLRWNSRMNLTAIRDPEQIITRHFGESFFLAHKLFQLRNYEITKLQIVDLGSGAGFPAIPLKIVFPDAMITLIEAQQRKATFLREALRALDLEAEVKNVRAETLPPSSADLVTLRAVEKFDQILPAAAHLIRQDPLPTTGHPEPNPSIGHPEPNPASGDPEATGHPEPSKGSLHLNPPAVPSRGLALLISSHQVARAQKLLQNWNFQPPIPIPNTQNRIIQMIEPR